MQSFVRFIDRLTGCVGFVGAWLVAPLVLSACYEVFSRYVLGSPTIWAYETGYMFTGANFLLGMAFAMRENAHIRVDVLYLRFSPRTKVIVNALSYALIVVPIGSWLAFALYRHGLSAYLSHETSGQSAWNPVVWPFRLSFFVAFAMLVLQALSELAKCLLLLRQTEPEERGHVVLPSAAGRQGSH